MAETHRAEIERLVFGFEADQRYTQDSPVLPDVWFEFAAQEQHDEEGRVEIDFEPVSLLLTPQRGWLPIDLRDEIAGRLETDSAPGDGAPTSLSFNDAYVAADLTFEQVIRVVLPLTKWWSRLRWPATRIGLSAAARKRFAARIAGEPPSPKDRAREPDPALLWLAALVGRIHYPRVRAAPLPSGAREGTRAAVDAFAELLTGLPPGPGADEASLWTINLDRRVTPALEGSVPAVKADAARRLFDLKCNGLRWAIVDSGVDAHHPALRRRTKDEKPRDASRQSGGQRGTRVLETYDFTKMRRLVEAVAEDPEGTGTGFDMADRRLWKDLTSGLQSGRVINWDRFRKALEIPHTEDGYRAPQHDHGTHVAGILAGEDWELDDESDGGAAGMCPDLELYDLRVLDENGKGREFSVLAALQFIRWLNTHQSGPRIHGVNISLSLIHDVANFACGRTPICDECERLVGAGVVVVVAAGNRGHTRFASRPGGHDEGWYRPISITDPGNADAVITVGATHRSKPHTYGVSYFSSRGPTGDGRSKPDLVAPGEKITSAVPGRQARTKDGTSMAAPHVSGAAAMLLARHRELIGDPARIKSVLCETATDLGRERAFQGAGMLDVLRALQSL